MNQQNKRIWGLISLAVGGAILLFGIYYVLDNVNKPWINQQLFMSFFVLPIGMAAFLLLGLGLLLLVDSRRSEQRPA